MLGEAVKKRDVAEARRLLDAGAPARARITWNGVTFPLAHVALEQGDYRMLELLLKHGADTQDAWFDYGSLLHAAVRRGQSARMVKLLLDHGARVGARDRGDSTPLHVAAHRGRRKVVEVLLDNDDIYDCLDMESGGYTAAMKAALEGHDDIARMLIDHGAYYDIYTASMLGDVKRVRELVNSGKAAPLRPVNPMATLTPFVAAAHRRRKDVMDFLLTKGADIDAENELDFGRTALETAIVAKDLEVTRFLLDHGANTEANDRHAPAVWTAAHANAPRILDLFETSGHTVPIYCRALAGDMAAVKAALEKAPALLNTPYVKPNGKQMLTLLHYAVMGEHLQLAEYLLEKGAAIDGGEAATIATPLHYAVSNNDVDMVKLLLKRGADPQATDWRGKTPEQWQAWIDPAIEALLAKADEKKEVAPD